MIFVALAILTAGAVFAQTDNSPLETGYCQIAVANKKICIGINSQDQAKKLDCSDTTKFRLFPDGSLRLLGRNNKCLQTGSLNELVYGDCSGAYTFLPKFNKGSPRRNTYKIYSTSPSYKDYFIAIEGDGAKDDTSVILYNDAENFKEFEQYFKLNKCDKDMLVYPLESIDENWYTFSNANNGNNKVTFSGENLNIHSVRMPCDGGWFKLYYNTGHFEIYSNTIGNLYCKGAGSRSWYGGEKYSIPRSKQVCKDGFVQYDVKKSAEKFEVYVNGELMYSHTITSSSGDCQNDITRVTAYVYDRRPLEFHLGIAA